MLFMRKYLCISSPVVFANTYMVLSLLITVLLLFFGQLPVSHEKPHFLRGMALSPLYQNDTLPIAVLDFIQTIRKSGKAIPDDTFISNDSSERRALNKREKNAIRYVARYPAINYIPQIVAGTLGYAVDLSPRTIFILSKSLCLLSGVLFGYIILRLLPAYHVPALILLLLPSGWLLRASHYPDYVVNMVALFYCALLLRALYFKTRLRWWHALAFIITGSILSISKIVYFPLVLSVLLLRRTQFASTWHFITWHCAVISCCLILTLCNTVNAFDKSLNVDILQQMENVFTSDADNTEPDEGTALPTSKVNMRVNDLLHTPTESISLLNHYYLTDYFWHRALNNIFVWKWNIDTLFGTWSMWLLMLALLPFFVSLTTQPAYNGTSFIFTWRDRLWLLTLILSVFFTIGIALYIWDGPERLIQKMGANIQGRYYIPLLPFIAMVCSISVPNSIYVKGSTLQLAFSFAIIALIFYFGVF